MGATYIREARDLVNRLMDESDTVAVTTKLGTAMAMINLLFEYELPHLMEYTGFAYEFRLKQA